MNSAGSRDGERPRSAWDEEGNAIERDVEAALGSPLNLADESADVRRSIPDEVDAELSAVVSETTDEVGGDDQGEPPPPPSPGERNSTG